MLLLLPHLLLLLLVLLLLLLLQGRAFAVLGPLWGPRACARGLRDGRQQTICATEKRKNN